MLNADIITVRHGKTEYSEKGIDLTDEGIIETKALARELAPTLSKYDNIIVVSSPLARTKGTAKIFLDEVGIVCEPRIMATIRCVDIHDILAFSSFSKQNSTSVYGEMWFNHPDLAEDSEFAEGRNSVNQRAFSFLRHMSSFISRIAKEHNQSICLLAFTHFEIATNYLRPLYPDNAVPSIEAPGLRNSESITISVSIENPNTVSIRARGLVARAIIQNNNLTFIDEE